MHFTAIYESENQLFYYRPSYGGACRTLYLKFRFLKFASVICLMYEIPKVSGKF